MKNLVKTKTFWVGLIALLTGMVGVFFPGDTFHYEGVGQLLTLVMNEKVLLGLGLITGRAAVTKLE